MRVRELREMLEEYDDNSLVVFQPENSSYVENFENAIGHRPISAFYGNDYEAIVIKSGGQCGSR